MPRGAKRNGKAKRVRRRPKTLTKAPGKRRNTTVNQKGMRRARLAAEQAAREMVAEVVG